MARPQFWHALALLCTIAYSNTLLADNNTIPIGRYLTVQNQPLPSQTNVFAQTFQVRFPRETNTVGGAVNYLLRFSGYRLAPTKDLPPSIQNLLALPETDRTLGPMPLQQGLLTLAGQPYGLLIDPMHRLISFRLKPRYLALSA